MCQHEGMFRRSANDRVLTGVAGGMGERLGIDPVVVRLAFVVLSWRWRGILCYIAAALVSRGPDATQRPRHHLVRARCRRSRWGWWSRGCCCCCVARTCGFGDGSCARSARVLGSAVIWTRGDDADRARWRRLLSRMPAT